MTAHVFVHPKNFFSSPSQHFFWLPTFLIIAYIWQWNNQKNYLKKFENIFFLWDLIHESCLIFFMRFDSWKLPYFFLWDLIHESCLIFSICQSNQKLLQRKKNVGCTNKNMRGQIKRWMRKIFHNILNLFLKKS